MHLQLHEGGPSITSSHQSRILGHNLERTIQQALWCRWLSDWLVHDVSTDMLVELAQLAEVYTPNLLDFLTHLRTTSTEHTLLEICLPQEGNLGKLQAIRIAHHDALLSGVACRWSESLSSAELEHCAIPPLHPTTHLWTWHSTTISPTPNPVELPSLREAKVLLNEAVTETTELFGQSVMVHREQGSAIRNWLQEWLSNHPRFPLPASLAPQADELLKKIHLLSGIFATWEQHAMMVDASAQNALQKLRSQTQIALRAIANA